DIMRRAQNERKANENLPGPLQLVAKEVNEVLNKDRMLQFTPREQLPGQVEQLQGQVLESLGNVQKLFNRPDVQDNQEARDIDTLATWLAVRAWELKLLQQQLQQQQQQQREFYFGGTSKIPDLLDFLVWKRQADKLGIFLTPADVSREVNRAWG